MALMMPNQAKIRSNGFLSAFNAVTAGQDSPLMDQLMQAVSGLFTGRANRLTMARGSERGQSLSQ